MLRSPERFGAALIETNQHCVRVKPFSAVSPELPPPSDGLRTVSHDYRSRTYLRSCPDAKTLKRLRAREIKTRPPRLCLLRCLPQDYDTSQLEPMSDGASEVDQGKGSELNVHCAGGAAGRARPGPHSQVAASNMAREWINAGHSISGTDVRTVPSFNRRVGSPIPIARHSTLSRFDSSQDSSPNKPLELSCSLSLVTSATMYPRNS